MRLGDLIDPNRQVFSSYSAEESPSPQISLRGRCWACRPLKRIITYGKRAFGHFVTLPRLVVWSRRSAHELLSAETTCYTRRTILYQNHTSGMNLHRRNDSWWRITFHMQYSGMQVRGLVKEYKIVRQLKRMVCPSNRVGLQID